MKKKNFFLLIDFYALFHRSRAALLRSNPNGFTSSSGIPTTGVFSTLRAILAQHKLKPDHEVVICVDNQGSQSRQEVNPEYKANRGNKDPNFAIEAKETLSLLRNLFYVHSVRGYEADDLIASFVRDKNPEDSVTILSCDKDLLPLVSPTITVELFNTVSRKWKVYDSERVCEEWGVDDPLKVKYVKALAGDSSDNIKGLKRVGIKTAAKAVMSLPLPSLEEWAESRQEGGGALYLTNLSLVEPKYTGDKTFLPSQPFTPRIEEFNNRLLELNIKSVRYDSN